MNTITTPSCLDINARHSMHTQGTRDVTLGIHVITIFEVVTTHSMEKYLTQDNQEINVSKFTSQSHSFHNVLSVTGCLAAALWQVHRRAAHSCPGTGERVPSRLLRGAHKSQNKYTRMTEFRWNRKLFLSKISYL